MLPVTLAQIAAATGGRVHGDPEVLVTAPASVDSRSIAAGGLFVAVAGERADGHAFAVPAVAAGAAAVLGSRPTAAPTVVVDDVVAALGRLARHLLDRLPDLRVLALTGSQGKTGTKDYLAAVLSAAGPTVATTGNLNNELGVPLTVLRATAETAYLVVEMGARHVGNIAYLCGVAPPQVAAVINVGTAHLGEFGSREAIARAKGEIVEALPPSGVAVLPADDPVVAGMASRTEARVLTFGPGADVAFRSWVADDLSRMSFELGYDGAWSPVRLVQPGAHQMVNAAAAAAMAIAVGVPLPDVARSLTAARPASRWRMEVHDRPDGVTVINDAYNANPESMAAALDTLDGIGRSGRRTIAVLGEMKELGEEHETAHRRVGATAAAAGVDTLVVVGSEAAAIGDGTAAVAQWQGRLVLAAGREEALAWVRENVAAGDVVLVKASRGVALEHVADGLLESAPGNEGEPR